MEKYMTRIKSSQYQTDIAKHLHKTEKENERRENFKVSLESLWKSVDSERSVKKTNFTIPANFERDNNQSTNRVSQEVEAGFRDYVTQIQYVRTSNDLTHRTTLSYRHYTDNLNQVDMSKLEQNENNLASSITAKIDFKEYSDHKQEVKRTTNNLLPDIGDRRKSLRRKTNFCYPKDFRLPSLGSQDPSSANNQHHESFTRRIDITIKSQPILKDKRRLSVGTKRPEEMKDVKAKPMTKTVKQASNKTQVTSSVTTDSEDTHQVPVIKVSVTIGANKGPGDPKNTFSDKNDTISTPSEATAVSPKLYEPFGSDGQCIEFVRGRRGLSTPPRPQVSLIKIIEDRKPTGELVPTVIPISTKELKKSSATSETAEVKFLNDKHEHKVTCESKSVKLSDTQLHTNVHSIGEGFDSSKCDMTVNQRSIQNHEHEDEDQNSPKELSKITQTERLSNPSISLQSYDGSFGVSKNTTVIDGETSDIEPVDGPTDDEHLVAGILETTAIKIHKSSLLGIPKLQYDRSSDSGLSKSPFSSEGVLTPSMNSEILTAYQRERLACIWRNRSNMGDINHSSGYIPHSDKTLKETKSPARTPRISKQSPRLTDCAVQQFPLRENLITAISQDHEYASYKRHLGQVIRRDEHSNPVYGLNPLYPGASFDEYERSDGGNDNLRDDFRKLEVVACVNVGSVNLKKVDEKSKPIISLPKVRWKKDASRIKEKDEKERMKLPSITNRVKQHKHGVKDCDCPDCSQKKARSKKRNKLPKIKGADGESDTEDYSYESNKLQWLSEQQQEKLYVFPGYIPPRLILMSSKLHKIHGVENMIREDTKGIIPIEYDFAKWTFTDLIDAVHKALNDYHFGSRARSILFLCQGGPGYAYILRNFVATPQKLRRKDFKPLVHFFRKLGCYLSKLDHEDTAIHFLGFDMEDNKQGKDLIKTIKQSLLPNQAMVEAPNENTAEERAIAILYFNPKEYYAWKTGDEIEETPRSWSSLAGRID
ncbi:hypothetical protein LOTGIDRAFT_173300 [Lottia gigantea]|uniref:DUF4347 domain-containing protein n=1 Tax=Lottia gigantea TaxID=225164 RepID=V4A8H5_LOTGI|nr:hypothetical protein LOTGIDRAFT_173300 [Lottia gigantea]ESP00274.1 hypothetical protein LOTGIDRAFT_173300 [Lottia gigantea]